MLVTPQMVRYAMRMQHPVIILGGGQMGGALARFWTDRATAGVHVVERDATRRADLSGSGVKTYADLKSVPLARSVFVLAIKPQQFYNLDIETKSAIAQSSLLVSIMAGVPLEALRQVYKHAARVMPNLPATIGAGMSVACAPGLDESRKRAVTDLFAATGSLLWLEDEEKMHAATAISGSGPAYLFAFMEAFLHAAEALGFSHEEAIKLVGNTLLGATRLVQQSRAEPSVLRTQVTSPGGTTEAALKAILGKLDPILEEATAAAAARSKELAQG